jgi:RHS repeat-associated protein
VAFYSRKSTGVNTLSYLLSDHQGSVAAITNSSGATVVSESNTPFGTRRNPTTWSGSASNADLASSASITREGYTFQTSLGLWMGLNHMNGRVQDNVTGRFMSADPGGTSLGSTQSWNRYSYTVNNPLTNTDPSGFIFINLETDGFSAFGASDPTGGDRWGSTGFSNSSGGLSFALSYNTAGNSTQQTVQVYSGPAQNTDTFQGNFFQTSGGWGWDSAQNPNLGSYTFSVGGVASGSGPGSGGGGNSGAGGASGGGAGGGGAAGGGGSGTGKSGAAMSQENLSAVTTTSVCSSVNAPAVAPSLSLGDSLALGSSMHSFLDATVGKSMEISEALPKVARGLGAVGGGLSVLTAIHGYETGNTYELVTGSADSIMFGASFVPGAQVVTGPYFAIRLGMEVVKTSYEMNEAMSEQARSQEASSCVR